MQTYILYHGGCPDGFGAAWAAWRKFGENAEYIPVKHGNPPPELPDDSQVWIIDFAYDRQTLLDMSQRLTLKVLDHHRTAQAELQGLDFAEFDMNRSGAVMSWNHFHPDQEVPELLQYVQDQDLWTWKLPHAKEICAALSVYPFDFEVWSTLDTDTLHNEGKIVLRYKDQLVTQLGHKADWIEICGQRVPAVNTALFASELGNQLCLDHPDAPFSACYSDFDGRRKFSLRSIGENDVAAVAAHFGGGGHRNASGFAIPSSGHPDVKFVQDLEDAPEAN